MSINLKTLLNILNNPVNQDICIALINKDDEEIFTSELKNALGYLKEDNLESLLDCSVVNCEFIVEDDIDCDYEERPIHVGYLKTLNVYLGEY